MIKLKQTCVPIATYLERRQEDSGKRIFLYSFFFVFASEKPIIEFQEICDSS